MSGAMNGIRTRFRHYVHEATRAPPKLCRRTVRHHVELFHRVQIHGERRPQPTALLAEEWIVRISAVDGYVVVNSTLAVNRDLIPVRSLHDGHTRRKVHEVE